MAYNYEWAKKAYQSMTREQQQQFVEKNKNDANFQRFAKEYAAEMSGKSTPTSIPTVSSSSAKTDTTATPKVSTANSAKADIALPEYQWTWSNKTNTYQNQWAGNYSYDTWTQYYEKQWTPVNTNYSSTRNAWDALSYEQQQEKLNQNPNLREWIIRIWWTIKEWPTWAKTSPYQNQWEGQYVYNPKTWYYEKKGGTQWTTKWWDYQDNSQARMDEIANNLNNYRITNPNLFDNWGSFYNFFIAWKWRTPEQEKFLTDYYNNMKRYNEYDNLSSDEVGWMIARWEIPDDYLNYLKNSDPQRWAEIQWARKGVEDQIMNETYLNTAASQAWFDMWDSDWRKWNKTEMWYRDVNNDWLDDRLYHAPTEEELKLVEENNQYEQERAKLNDAMKWLQEDLTNQYPDADLSTIMILTSDRWNKIQRALDTLAVNQTKVQWSLKYLQNERATMDDAWQRTIDELQKQYWMYYDYSPEWISKLAQAKYAATNVTLDQADNWTYTQKQMALESVLTPIYQQYWSIIQRPMAQVINDVIAYAQNKWISLSKALEENFMTPLKSKPAYKQLSSAEPYTVKVWDTLYEYDFETWEFTPVNTASVWEFSWLWTMRTERNNNPTAMTTDVAKSLWWIEWVDYVQWDSFKTWDGRTLYTAKLIGDPIETTIRLLDNAANSWKWAFYTKWWAKRWTHTAMSDKDWLALTPEQKQNVVLQMLQREGWDITKMPYYNQWGNASASEQNSKFWWLAWWNNDWYSDNLVKDYELYISDPSKVSKTDIESKYAPIWMTYYDFTTQAQNYAKTWMKDKYVNSVSSSLEAAIELYEYINWAKSDVTLWDLFTKWVFTLFDGWNAQKGLTNKALAYMPWTKQKDAKSYFDALNNRETLQKLIETKAQWATYWAMSEWEWKLLASAANLLDRNQSWATFQKNLEDLIYALSTAVQEWWGKLPTNYYKSSASNMIMQWENAWRWNAYKEDNTPFYADIDYSSYSTSWPSEI